MKYADIQVGQEYAQYKGQYSVRDAVWAHRVRVVDVGPFLPTTEGSYYAAPVEELELANGQTVNMRFRRKKLTDTDRRAFVAVVSLDGKTGQPEKNQGPWFVSVRQLHRTWVDHAAAVEEYDRQEKFAAEVRIREKGRAQRLEKLVLAARDRMGLNYTEIRQSYDVASTYKVEGGLLLSLLEHAEATGWAAQGS